MMISCVMPTYKREDLLRRAVESVLAQVVDGADVEVIVVNDAGEPLQSAEWQSDPRVTLVNTQHVERCYARNTGASMARGDYLHFLDDDDVILPGCYQALLNVARESGAGWVYGAYEQADDDGIPNRTVPPWPRGSVFAVAVAGLAIPMGASLIRRDIFLQAGGFDPALRVSQDAELLQRMSVITQIECTEEIVSRFRVGATPVSTTKWDLATECGRLQREKALSVVGAAGLLRSSYIHHDILGRVVRSALASGYRHLKSGNLFTAGRRAWLAAALLPSGVFHAGFWRGLVGRG
ncbi:MAG: glycosyltransferase family 2 protein [Armatimonadetes bacterium]|nr:glycosyltransferase family 2 protein [Armatimonadota bacterium]